MSWSQFLKHKNSKFVWWGVAVVVGLAMFLLMWPQPNLTVPAPKVAPTPAIDPAVDPQNEGAAAEEEFLADYDPDTITLLDINPGETDQSVTWQFTQLIFKLAVVLGLVYLVLHGLKWLQRNKSKQLPRSLGNGATINILETTGLAPGRFLHLVVVGEKTLLLGATDHQISVLAELQDTAVPLTEEDNLAFDEALSRHTQTPEPVSPPPTPPPVSYPKTIPQSHPQPVPLVGVPLENLLDEKMPAAEYTPDWQSALKNLRTGIRNIQESVGG
jgi:flagellar biogenesis protein FliO